MKTYTEHQQAYIDSVDGIAHNSAVELVGLLDARIDELKAQLAAAQEREQWIPVTKQRPERSQNVEVTAQMQYDGEDHWITEDGTVLEPGNVLDWRELPLPKREATDDQA